MALWMDAGSEPMTENEKADLEAISAIKESAGVECKEQGNDCVWKGKKHYSEAFDFNTNAINQGVLSDSETSILLSNRARVNLLLGNYRRAFTDAEEELAIRLSPDNFKRFGRCPDWFQCFKRRCIELQRHQCHCVKGIENDPSREELKKLLKQVNSNKQEKEQHEAHDVSKAVMEAKAYLSAFENRGVKKPISR